MPAAPRPAGRRTPGPPPRAPGGARGARGGRQPPVRTACGDLCAGAPPASRRTRRGPSAAHGGRGRTVHSRGAPPRRRTRAEAPPARRLTLERVKRAWELILQRVQAVWLPLYGFLRDGRPSASAPTC